VSPRRDPRPGMTTRALAEGLGEAVAAALVLLSIVVLLSFAPDVDAVVGGWGRP